MHNPQILGPLKPERGWKAALAALAEQIGSDAWKPGFYDHPHFLAAEQKGEVRLADYARYVHAHTYSPAYLHHASATIERLGKGIHEALLQEQSVGRCIDACKVLSKMLEAEGVWNYVVGGAVGIYHRGEQPRKPIHFYQFDILPIDVGHAWVVAPPFGIVDVTLKLQPYQGLQRQHIPAYLFIRHTQPVRVAASDLCTPALLRGLRKRGYSDTYILTQGLSSYAEHAEALPAAAVAAGELNIRYIPCKMIAPVGSLAALQHITINGQTPTRLFAALQHGASRA